MSYIVGYEVTGLSSSIARSLPAELIAATAVTPSVKYALESSTVKFTRGPVGQYDVFSDLGTR